MRVSWFSAGVSSAVATKLGYPLDEIIYTHIKDQHEDTMRFIRDCEKWFNQKITILQSPLESVENACCQAAFINSPYGAACTRLLKKRVRKEWEYQHQNINLVYVWGLDATEKKRAERIVDAMKEVEHEFPLIEKNITKEEAHRILKASGIKRPTMYELGYNNNNCIGCVKGGQGYWNKIRQDFPEVFNARMELEKKLGATCLKYPLSELQPATGRLPLAIIDDCGLFCEMMAIE